MNKRQAVENRESVGDIYSSETDDVEHFGLNSTEE